MFCYCQTQGLCEEWRQMLISPPEPFIEILSQHPHHQSTLLRKAAPFLTLVCQQSETCWWWVSPTPASLGYLKFSCWNSPCAHQPADPWGSVNCKLSQLIYMFQVLIASQFLNGLRSTVFSCIWLRLFSTWPIFHGSHLLYLIISYTSFCIDFFSFSESTLVLFSKCWIWC